MTQDILEKLKNESESLYNAVLHYSAKKWNVIDFKKLSSEMYIVTLSNKKKPNKIMKYRCFFNIYRWIVLNEPL